MEWGEAKRIYGGGCPWNDDGGQVSCRVVCLRVIVNPPNTIGDTNDTPDLSNTSKEAADSMIRK